MFISVNDKKKFNQALILQGFTKRSFAKKIGVSPSFISNISTGKINPSAPTAKRICEALSVEFDDLFEIKESAKEEKQTT